MLSLECPAIVCFCFAFALFFALLLHLLSARDSNQRAAGEMAGHNLELRRRQPIEEKSFNLCMQHSTFISFRFIKGHVGEREGGGNVPREDANTDTNTSENERLAGER